MSSNIKIFASIAARLGSNEIILDIPSTGIKAGELISILTLRYPRIEDSLRYARIAVNYDFVPFYHIIYPDDEVAIIQAVSGG